MGHFWCILVDWLVRTYSRRQAAAKAPNSELDSRLNGYFATLRASSFGDVLRRSVDNWQIYAAVTGSAVAMATNASASVIYSGVLNQKAAVKSIQPGSLVTVQSMTTKIDLKNGAGAPINVDFKAFAQQGQAGLPLEFGAVGLRGSQVDFLLESGFVKRLSSGAKISGGTPATTTQRVAFRSIHSGRRQSFGWSRTEGFAGFSFEVNGQKDFGWVRLQFTVGSNTLINSLTVIDWGYQNNGSVITAGQGIPITAPEPPTADLAFLALGAAGVTALRRRRRQASA